MSKENFSTVMSPGRLIEELKALNPAIELEIVSWNKIEVLNMSVEEVILPKDFSVLEKESYKLKLTNAQDEIFGQYQVVLFFLKP